MFVQWYNAVRVNIHVWSDMLLLMPAYVRHASTLPPGSVMNVYQSLATAWTQTIPQGVPTVVSIAGQNWYLDSEGGGYNQDGWTHIYSLNGPSGSWLANPAWSPAEAALLLGGETAMWGEGINHDNFDAFVWRDVALLQTSSAFKTRQLSF
eukprot:m.721451 g.721451  ORF g.721451 m.721451 type:complete len:151 (+) comp23013_c0_seq15:1935-2387(+)